MKEILNKKVIKDTNNIDEEVNKWLFISDIHYYDFDEHIVIDGYDILTDLLYISITNDKEVRNWFMGQLMKKLFINAIVIDENNVISLFFCENLLPSCIIKRKVNISLSENDNKITIINGIDLICYYNDICNRVFLASNLIEEDNIDLYNVDDNKCMTFPQMGFDVKDGVFRMYCEKNLTDEEIICLSNNVIGDNNINLPYEIQRDGKIYDNYSYIIKYNK